MNQEILRIYDSKADFDACDLVDIDTATIPGKAILDTEWVGGGNITLDATTNNRDLDTDAGSSIVSLVAGMYGTYAIKATINQYMKYYPGDDVDVFPGADEATVEATFKLTEAPVGGGWGLGVLGFWDEGGSATSSTIWVYITSARHLICRVDNKTGTLLAEIDYGVVDLDQWYRIAITIDVAQFSAGYYYRQFKFYVDNMVTPVDTKTFTTESVESDTDIDCDAYYVADLGYINGSLSAGELIVDEIRVSTKIRSSAEMADPGSGGFSVDGDTWALWHCEEVVYAGVEQYKSPGTIKTQEFTGDGFIYPSQINKLVSALPANTKVEMRWRAGEFVFGSWSSYTEADQINFAEVILYKKFQIEIQLSTTDVLETPELDMFNLMGEESTGGELTICELSKFEDHLESCMVSLGYTTRIRLYDNRLIPYWETEPDTWILQRYEAEVLPINDGWRVMVVGDSSESIVSEVFNTNTTSGSWGKDNMKMLTGQQIQIRFKKVAEGATERRGFEFEYDGNTRRINLYFWNDYVSFAASKVNGYTIDTSAWHIYQIYLGGTGANEIELRIDGDPTIRATGTQTGVSAGGVIDGWQYPDNSYASAPHGNMELDYIRSGYYEPWITSTYTLENSEVKDLYAYADLIFDTAQDISMAYIGRMHNIKEWSLQYWNGSIWKDWWVEMTVGDEFNNDFWWDRKDVQVSAEKIRFLIHDRIDTGELAKLGEIYIGNILYQTPDTPQNIEDTDEGRQGDIELGSGKNVSWQEYESYFGRLLFNLMNDRHQKKLREFQSDRQFVVLLEPVDRIDRFYKVTWQKKWKSEYSTGFRETGWDIEMILKQTI